MIPAELVLTETENWMANHRIGSTYPGYLMVVSKQNVTDINQLSTKSLEEIGPLLANLESAIMKTYAVKKVLVAKLGFTAGINCHFHIVPVHPWVLGAISENPAYADEPDGNDVMLYVNREYCECQNKDEALSVASKAIAEITLQMR